MFLNGELITKIKYVDVCTFFVNCINIVIYCKCDINNKYVICESLKLQCQDTVFHIYIYSSISCIQKLI